MIRWSEIGVFRGSDKSHSLCEVAASHGSRDDPPLLKSFRLGMRWFLWLKMFYLIIEMSWENKPRDVLSYFWLHPLNSGWLTRDITYLLILKCFPMPILQVSLLSIMSNSMINDSVKWNWGVPGVWHESLTMWSRCLTRVTRWPSTFKVFPFGYEMVSLA